MAFKVASRVRGMSDEAFRKAFGREERCRAALVRLRWPDGFVRPSCGHRVLAGRGLYQCNRCKKQSSPTAGSIFHSTKLPLRLGFAGHPPDGDGQERGVVGGTRSPPRGQAADGLGHEAQDHGGDGPARRREAALGPGEDGRRLSRRQAFRQQAGSGCSRQDALRRCSLDRPRGTPAQAEAGAGQGVPQAPDRAWRPALAGSGIGGRDRRPWLLERVRRGCIQLSGDPHRLGTQGGLRGRNSNGPTQRSATSRARLPGPTARSAPTMPSVTSPPSPVSS